ncbi:MAG: tetratricopeptide repeat protein [Desulfuromonadales bacterium]
MNRFRFLIGLLPLLVSACATVAPQGTIAELRNKEVVVEDVPLVGGLDKAMLSYQAFLVAAPETKLAPEAIRRLADLKVEKEYGLLTPGSEPQEEEPSAVLPAHETTLISDLAPTRLPDAPAEQGESEDAFVQRAADNQDLAALDRDKGPADLQRDGPLEAIALYQKLLDEYPLYDRNDQVLYQMSRAYEELGRVEEAMEVMNQMVKGYPQTRYIDEVQFRRGEYYFTRRQYLDAEQAYLAIIAIGEGSAYYPYALYKLGWTFYKQELYEEALDQFIALLDYKVSIGYDFEQTTDEPERKRTEDTFRVISLSFSYLGGADRVAAYFDDHGDRSYEDLVYQNLGEYYFDKRRYADANATYSAFVERNPFHVKAPGFQARIIAINIAGGFPSLVLEAKKAYATQYGLEAEYWDYFDPSERPDVLADLKTNVTDLANHYHALYQDKEFQDDKPANFAEALHWYREFLASFPQDQDSPAVNYQLADLLLENNSFGQAALEYEKTAYDYPDHEKSSTAGYAAVYAYREHLGDVASEEKDAIKREVVRSSVRFAETFPAHDKAPVVLGAAVDDLYDMQAYEQAVLRAHQLVESFPQSDAAVRQSAWIVVGHASYELERYAEAEAAYLTVLALLPEEDERREGLVDNLAASIYEQGEAANAAEDYRTAANHFLRVSQLAPASAIRPNAEYDAATALIQLQDWSAAAGVLNGFRQSFPDHALQPEVTKKMAYVYREDGRLADAAEEFERIETETDDDQIRMEALLTAAELYQDAGNQARTLDVYQRYVSNFPEPVDVNIETRHKISLLLKAAKDDEGYFRQLEKIVAIDSAAGSSRTERTRYLASRAALVLAEQTYEQFVAIQLVRPFKVNLQKKQVLMKENIQTFNRLLEYQDAEVTAASTFYLAEIYAHFSKALMASERPVNLTPLELEEYELAIEEQAYPFEEKSIAVHESNLELLSRGIYNDWIEKSLTQLARIMPARYHRPEAETPVIESLASLTYEIEGRPVQPEVAAQDNELTPGGETTGEPELTRQGQETEVNRNPATTEPDEAQTPTENTSGSFAQDRRDASDLQSAKQQAGH